ncbi:hypothetical protein [Natrinema pallidum]|uniref:hypothetical protein n=1 Tax=Natrinema pallidum TaxID=69527 RepID=UPI0037502816
MTTAEECWQERLAEARIRVGSGLEPELLAERYDAETEDEIEQLTTQATKEMIRGGHTVLTLDDLDEAEEKLEGAGFEVATDGGQNPSDPEWAFRSAVALDYIQDAQREWNSLSPEECHGSMEMARWVLEDAEFDELTDHDFYDESLQPSSGTELSDSGVAAANGLVCQNFDVHDEEVKMVSGPYDGVQCPECGRMAGGSPPLDIPYVDEPGTPAAQSDTDADRNGGESA